LIDVVADTLTQVAVVGGRHNPVFLNAGAITDEQSDVAGVVRSSDLRPETAVAAGPAGVDWAGNDFLSIPAPRSGWNS
jgi:hypothetical protein